MDVFQIQTIIPCLGEPWCAQISSIDIDLGTCQWQGQDCKEEIPNQKRTRVASEQQSKAKVVKMKMEMEYFNRYVW